MSDINQMMSDMQERMEWLRKQSEPLDEDTIELLREELITCLGKCNRICSMLLNRPRGLGIGVMDALDNIKLELSRVKWYLEQRDKQLPRVYRDDIMRLAKAYATDDGPLGESARKLLEVLPLGA